MGRTKLSFARHGNLAQARDDALAIGFEVVRPGAAAPGIDAPEVLGGIGEKTQPSSLVSLDWISASTSGGISNRAGSTAPGSMRV